MPALTGTSTSHFTAPHPRLRPYLTTYYFTSIDSAGSEDVADWLHPEWASVRYCYEGATRGAIHPDLLQAVPPIHVTGPTTRAQPFAARHARIASIGFMPVGWARFFGEPAANWADRSADVAELKSPVDFAAIGDALRTAPSFAAMTELFDAMLLPVLDARPLVSAEVEARINAAHIAIMDPGLATVAALADRLGLTVTQIERFSRRYFGFPPKRLLQRQRFIRTLAAIMRDPTQSWVDALDPGYYDQAQFNREFRRIFGITPVEYRRHPHPVLYAAAAARTKALGDPLQTLQRPSGDR